MHKDILVIENTNYKEICKVRLTIIIRIIEEEIEEKKTQGGTIETWGGEKK